MYAPHALLTLVLVGAALLIGTSVARRVGLAAPVVLLVAGVLLSLTPALHDIAVAPEPDERTEAEMLRNELLSVKRATVVALRDEHVISDTVLLRLQAQLDAEENRVNPPSTVD
ncbi:MAG: hypothetical protein GEV28_33350 [Actinophytocola sp.]|uniref:hypothetical protein n=1 Tax=Actinophytocola sp. TaxID=1872138 RepID=UPI001325D79C|nr:hypothetical protein [Actinophytocola sp.]MPZ85012.1 hypothetical protein [Actinophytocola sp.]